MLRPASIVMHLCKYHFRSRASVWCLCTALLPNRTSRPFTLARKVYRWKKSGRYFAQFPHDAFVRSILVLLPDRTSFAQHFTSFAFAETGSLKLRSAANPDRFNAPKSHRYMTFIPRLNLLRGVVAMPNVYRCCCRHVTTSPRRSRADFLCQRQAKAQK